MKNCWEAPELIVFVTPKLPFVLKTFVASGVHWLKGSIAFELPNK